MKLKFNLIMITVALLMAACGSDNNSNDDSTPAEDITGTYAGYTVADFQYTSIPMTTAGESISLVANADGTCNISFESSTWGKFTISDASVVLKNDNYTITGSGETVMGHDAASQKTYACTIEGTISKDKKTVSLMFNVPAVMGGLEVTFTQGDAPANMVIAKSYSGSLVMSVQGTDMGTDDDSKVTIKSQEDGKAEVTLAAFGTESGMGFSNDIVVTDVEVTTESDGSYSISGTIDTTSGTTNVTGSLEGTIKAGKAEITFSLKPGAMPMYITAVFTSN